MSVSLSALLEAPPHTTDSQVTDTCHSRPGVLRGVIMGVFPDDCIFPANKVYFLA